MSSNRMKAFTVLALLVGVVALVVVFLPRDRSADPATLPSIPASPASQPGQPGRDGDGVAKPGVLVQRDGKNAGSTAGRSVREVRGTSPTTISPIDGDSVSNGRVSLAAAPVPMMGMIPQTATSLPVPGSSVAPDGVVSTPSLSGNPAAPAAPVEPAFCPIGAQEKAAKASVGGRERFCTRADKGGIAFREGPYLAFHPNGKKRAEGAYVGGRMGGAWAEYYDTGRKAGEGEYAQGKRSGNWVFFWETGRGKSSEGLFRAGNKNGRWIFYDDRGRKESEGELKTTENVERETGRWTYWHPNGTKRAEGTYRDGRREGKWTEFNVSGKVASVDLYRDGEKE